MEKNPRKPKSNLSRRHLKRSCSEYTCIAKVVLARSGGVSKDLKVRASQLL